MTVNIMDESEVANIPVPDQIPTRLDLSQIPTGVLRSAVVEALANQNEDLMARLSVALKRSSVLEARISDLESDNQALAQRAESFQDQMLILKEKDNLLSERAAGIEKTIEQYQNQIQLLETQYAELYSTGKERSRLYSTQVDLLSRRLERFSKYRKNMKRVARHLALLLKNTRIALTTGEATTRDLKQKLGDAALRIQFLAREADTNQKKIVEGYEGQLRELREQIGELKKQNLAYDTKSAEMERLLDGKKAEMERMYDAKVEIENRLILEGRNFAQYREAKEQELGTLSADLASFRNNAKVKVLEIEGLKSELAKTQRELTDRNEEVRKMTDQIESLQLLWHDKEAQTEKQTIRHQALQKLNQQLSSTINQQRKEIQTLKMTLESQAMVTSEKIKEIKGQLLLMEKKELNFVEAAGVQKPALLEAPAPAKILSRVDTLIAEIQSGFKYQPPEEAAAGTSPGTSISSSASGESLGSGATSAP